MAKKTTIKPLAGKHGDFSGIALKAAASGNLPALRKYLKQHPDWLNRVGPHGRTLLWEAAYKGRTKTVAALLKLGADHSPMGSYYTPMLVELSALAVARMAGKQDLVELLQQHGATDDLYAACHRGDLDAIDRYCSEDPSAANRPAREDVEPHRFMGYHPIHYAIVGNHPGAMRLLVGYEAEVWPHMELLLHWSKGRREATKFLREYKKQNPVRPKPQVKNRRSAGTGRKKATPSKPRVPAVDRPDWMGFPPLVDACRGNHNAPDDPARVQKLIDRGATINIQDHKRKTPLHRASQAGFLQITQLLLDHGADLEIADQTGGTPLFDAAQHGRTKTIRLLLAAGANLHHQDNRGETPLFAAARQGKIEAFDCLLKAGGDPHMENKKGKAMREIVSAARHQTEGRKAVLKKLAQLTRRKRSKRQM